MKCTLCDNDLKFNDEDESVKYYSCHCDSIVHYSKSKINDSCVGYFLIFNHHEQKFFIEGVKPINLTIFGKMNAGNGRLGKEIFRLKFITIPCDEDMLNESWRIFHKLKELVIFS